MPKPESATEGRDMNKMVHIISEDSLVAKGRNPAWIHFGEIGIFFGLHKQSMRKEVPGMMKTRNLNVSRILYFFF